MAGPRDSWAEGTKARTTLKGLGREMGRGGGEHLRAQVDRSVFSGQNASSNNVDESSPAAKPSGKSKRAKKVDPVEAKESVSEPQPEPRVEVEEEHEEEKKAATG